MKQLFLLTVIIFSVYGCKKTDCDGRDNPVVSLCRLSAVIDPVAKDTFRITTTADGKLSTVILRDEISNYNYSTGTTTISKFVNGVYTDRTTIIFNSDGLAINVKQERADGTNWTRTIFEYNGNEVSRASHFFSGAADPIIVTYSWVDHNLVSISSGGSSIPLEYYADKPNQEYDHYGLIQFFSGYRLFRSKNLLKSLGGNVYSYGFGPDGKIASISNNGVQIYKYEYECK